MRSRTSQGVPEWSGGKDLYMGSPVLVTEKVWVLSVTYRDHREGPGGPPSGATSPGGLHGPIVGGEQPLVGWCAPPPTKAQGARESGRGQTLGSDGPKAHLVVRLPLPPLAAPLDGI